MKRNVFAIVCLLVACAAWGQSEKDTAAVQVHGKVHAGISTELNTCSDLMELDYTTDNPMMGSNSGNHYSSDLDEDTRFLRAHYGVDLELELHPQHTLALTLEGVHSYEKAMGERTESLTDKNGQLLSRVRGAYNRPKELQNELKAGFDYTYRLRRPGEALSLGYQYRWENESAGVEQEVEENIGWSEYKTNVLEQKINYHYHHAHLDYCYPVAKGHLLDFGLAYDRRELSVRTEQEWDEVRRLDTDYRHLMQYGGVHARYRLRLGPVEAMARLEYRATRMQNRWVHDVLPTATIRYHIDSVHSLSAFYTIVLIRPDAQRLDTTKIEDAYTQTFGSNRLVGIHVHNVALTYRMKMDQTDFSTELRYLTTNDGFNAIWTERREDKRKYTWGNEGVRHAVSLTPKVESALGHTTKLHASATVMWDKRIAENEVIHMENANWGLQSKARLSQQLYARSASGAGNPPLELLFSVQGEYNYHNTLDVYSYAGHGGLVGGELDLSVWQSLRLSLGYDCRFQQNVHITQGAYVGLCDYSPGIIHELSLNLSYQF